jgi:hypothetical protein
MQTGRKPQAGFQLIEEPREAGSLTRNQRKARSLGKDENRKFAVIVITIDHNLLAHKRANQNAPPRTTTEFEMRRRGLRFCASMVYRSIYWVSIWLRNHYQNG